VATAFTVAGFKEAPMWKKCCYPERHWPDRDHCTSKNLVGPNGFLKRGALWTAVCPVGTGCARPHLTDSGDVTKRNIKKKPGIHAQGSCPRFLDRSLMFSIIRNRPILRAPAMGCTVRFLRKWVFSRANRHAFFDVLWTELAQEADAATRGVF